MLTGGKLSSVLDHISRGVCRGIRSRGAKPFSEFLNAALTCEHFEL